MKKFIFSSVVFFGALFFFGAESYGQTVDKFAEFDKDSALLRQDLRSVKKQVLAINLTLTDAEAAKFWTVYDQYSAEVGKVYDERAVLIKEYAKNYPDLTDSAAESLVKSSINNEEALVKLRKKYQPIIAKVLPGKKTALFFQLDKRLSLLIDLQLASEIPLATQ